MKETEAQDIVQALRSGVVPRRGLHHLATGMDALMRAVDQELDFVAGGRGTSKWIRGEYGSGKTFATRLLATRARQRGFATAEVQISINDTPLHQLETVYRRLVERLETESDGSAAFQAIIDGWLYQVGDEVQRLENLSEDDPRFSDATEKRLEDKLSQFAGENSTFPAVLRGYHRAMHTGDFATAQGLIAWLSGQPSVSSTLLGKAGVRGKVDGAAALTFLSGLLCLLSQTGRPGLVLILDEVETIQRMPGPTRQKALIALRQLVDLLADDRLPGLYLVVTGTRDFFEGYKGTKGEPALHQRVSVQFGEESRFDNLRAPQVRLLPFDAPRLFELGQRVRDLFPASNLDRIAERVPDAFLEALVAQVTTGFGGKVQVAPRTFLRELVDVLDRVDQHADFDPLRHYKLSLVPEQLNVEELAAQKGLTGESDDVDEAPRRGRLEG